MVRVSSRSMYVDKSLKTTLHVEDVQNFLTLHLTPDYVDIEEIHDFWEIVYLESGEAIATADDRSVPLFPGDVIFHKPGEVHAIHAANNTTAKVFFICFYSTSKTVRLFESLKIALGTEQKKMIYQLYEEARSIYLSEPWNSDSVLFNSRALSPNAPTGAQQIFRNHLEEFLILVIQLIEKREQIISYRSREELESFIYNKMIEKLAESVYSHISIEDLCNELNYGKTYLSILFKKHSGESIMSYYNTLKIKEAKKLIKEGKHSLSDIAEMLHFNNQYYFSRVFKKIEGQSPSEYKSLS